MGLPSGTHRTMRVDLTGKFLSADHHVRIVTNLCVYWDQIFFTTDERPRPRRGLSLVSMRTCTIAASLRRERPRAREA